MRLRKSSPNWARRNFGLNLTVVRRLVKLHPEGTAQALLQFLPYAADEECEEEIWFGLDTLAKAEPQLVAALVGSLRDKIPIRRAAAGYLLARRGNGEQKTEAKKLLTDSDPLVRLRTAQGLLGAKDKDAIPVLIELLEKLRWTEEAWQAEEMLHWVAGNDAPEPTVGAGAPEARQKCLKAWDGWWQANAGKIDFAKLEQDYRRPGLMLVLISNGDIKNLTHHLQLIGCDGHPAGNCRHLSDMPNSYPGTKFLWQSRSFRISPE
jgi:hypothetical protein